MNPHSPTSPHPYALMLATLLVVMLSACTPLYATKSPSYHVTSDVFVSSYVVLGKRYSVLASGEGFIQRGIASWYGKEFHGRKTSSGTVYNMYLMTAAHKNLPLGSWVTVEHLETRKVITVLVNDRGPFHEDRVIDLSYGAAKKLGMVETGTAPVLVRVVSSPPPPPAKPSVAVAPQPAATGSLADSLRGTSVPVYIQLGAFGNADNAALLARTAEEKGYSVVVVAKHLNGKKIHRVRLGPMDYATHEKLLPALKDDGFVDSVRMYDDSVR